MDLQIALLTILRPCVKMNASREKDVIGISLLSVSTGR